MRFLVIALFGPTAVLCCAAADVPRTNRVVCAIEAPICARAYVKRNETIVERSNRETRRTERLWSTPQWLNVVRVDESGEHLLVEASTFGVLPTEAGPDFVVLRLYARGTLRREVTLGEVYPTEASLLAAVRAGAWAKALGSSDTGTARYLLTSGAILKFNLATAALAIE